MTDEELVMLSRAILNIAPTVEDRQKVIGRLLISSWAWQMPLKTPDTEVDTIEHYFYNELKKLHTELP